MVNFNLYPWREKRRAYERRHLNFLLGLTFILSLFISFSDHYCLQMRFNHWQDKLNESLNIEKKFQSELLSMRGEVNDQLNQSETEWRHRDNVNKKLLTALANGDHQRSHLCFTDITANHHKIIFSGKVDASRHLLNFLDEWQGKYLFSEIKIEKLQNNGSLTFRFQALE